MRMPDDGTSVGSGERSADPTADPRVERVRHQTIGPTYLGFSLLALVVLMAIFAPIVAPANPSELGVPFARPSGVHLLGTDDVGHDLWAHLVHGARVSVVVGLATATIAMVFALTVALVSVYRRGWFETIAYRVVDLTLGLPFLVLVIVVAVFVGRSVAATVAVLSFVLWARPARVLLASAMRLHDAPHVVVARASGASPWWVIRRHLLSRIAPQATSQFVRLVNLAVLSEASLAFLGLGDPGRVSWGTTLYFANSRSAFLTGAWVWWILPPALGLTLLSSGLALIGFGVEERSDPRLRGGPPGTTRASTRSSTRFAQPAETRPVTEPDQLPSPTSKDGLVEDLVIGDLVVEYLRNGVRLRAVDHVSVNIANGAVVGLIGESGCGKSSIASALMGLVASPGEVVSGFLRLGVIDIDLRNSDALSPVRGRLISLIPQSSMNALNPSQRIVAQVHEAATVGGPGAADRADDALSAVQITEDERRRFPHQLSGGQRQRSVIATAMVNAPRLVIADEATSGLDPLTQRAVLGELTRRCESSSSALLLISHDLPLVGRFADRIVVMYAGRVVEDGSAWAVMNRPAHPYTKALLAANPRVGEASPPRPIAGDVPDLADLPSGCAFRTRCPVAEARCANAVPPLVAMGIDDVSGGSDSSGTDVFRPSTNRAAIHAVACVVRSGDEALRSPNRPVDTGTQPRVDL